MPSNSDITKRLMYLDDLNLILIANVEISTLLPQLLNHISKPNNFRMITVGNYYTIEQTHLYIKHLHRRVFVTPLRIFPLKLNLQLL